MCLKESGIIAKDNYVVYTDGSALGNPGPAGYGSIITLGNLRTELSGGYKRSTNNRMEILAAVVTLESISGKRIILLHTDSQYVINGITKWVSGWKRNGWCTRDGTSVKNKDLWVRLEEAAKEHKVYWIKVRAHSGIALNEEVDILAKKAAACPTLIDHGYID